MHRFTAFQLSDRPVCPFSLPLFRDARQRKKKRKKREREREKNVQERTLTSAACNIPYGRSSVIFSGKSVAAALSLFLSLYRVEAGPDSGFSTEGREGGMDSVDAGREKEDREDDESRGDC